MATHLVQRATRQETASSITVNRDARGWGNVDVAEEVVEVVDEVVDELATPT